MTDELHARLQAALRESRSTVAGRGHTWDVADALAAVVDVLDEQTPQPTLAAA